MHDKYVLAATRWVVKRSLLRRGHKVSRYTAKEITQQAVEWLNSPKGIKFAEMICDLSN